MKKKSTETQKILTCDLSNGWSNVSVGFWFYIAARRVEYFTKQ